MDDIEIRIKEYLTEHLKFEIDANKNEIEFRVYLEHREGFNISQTPIHHQILVLDDVLDEDTANTRYATKEYVEENFAFKE